MLIKWLVNLRRWETGQWSGADDNPSIVADLLQEEMQEGWIEEVVGGENKLKQRFPQVASGKLNLALAPNRSCSYLNPKSHSAVVDAPASMSCVFLTLDVAKAHRIIQDAP